MAKKGATLKSKADEAKLPEPLITAELAEMQRDALQKLRDAKVIYLSVDELEAALERDWNPGGRGPMDYIDLLASIKMIGLKKEIIVSEIEDAKKLVTQGYLRSDALIHWAKEPNSNFAEAFPKGVPVRFVKGVTRDQAYFLAQDHDTVARNRWAIAEQAMAMFRRGYSEKAVAVQMHAELASSFGLKADVRKDIAEATNDAERQDRIAKYWRQRTQEYRAASKLPARAVNAYKNKVLGLDGEKITGAQIKELGGLNASGTVAKPTNEYLNKIEAFITENASGITGPKPLPQSKMKEDYTRFQSTTFQAVSLRFGLSLDVDLFELDTLVAEAEKSGKITIPQNVLDVVEKNHNNMLVKKA